MKRFQPVVAGVLILLSFAVQYVVPGYRAGLVVVAAGEHARGRPHFTCQRVNAVSRRGGWLQHCDQYRPRFSIG